MSEDSEDLSGKVVPLTETAAGRVWDGTDVDGEPEGTGESRPGEGNPSLMFTGRSGGVVGVVREST